MNETQKSVERATFFGSYDARVDAIYPVPPLRLKVHENQVDKMSKP